MLKNEDIHFVTAIASTGSLAAAARSLGVSAPAVTQHLRAIEDRIGVRLVNRSGSHLSLTNDGELIVARGKSILRDVSALSEELELRRGVVSGHLKVLAPFGFGRTHIAAFIAAFRSKYPEMTIDLRLSDKVTSVPTNEWDIAIHVGELSSAAPSLQMQKLAANSRFLCAAAGYLKIKGIPRNPKDLLRHDCLVLQENDEDFSRWRFKTASGGKIDVRVAPSMLTNDGQVLKTWAIAGLGLAIRSEWDVADDIKSGRLVRVLKSYTLPSADVIVLLGTKKETRTASVNRLLDSLRKHFTRPPWRHL